MPHPFFETLKAAKNPVVIVGQGAFLRPDGEAIHAALYDFATKMGVVKEGWNGFNVLQTNASRVGALDIGFLPQRDGMNAYGILTASQQGELDVLYLLGVDEFDSNASLGDKTFVIYQGHHGDQGLRGPMLFCPGSLYRKRRALCEYRGSRADGQESGLPCRRSSRRLENSSRIVRKSR